MNVKTETPANPQGSKMIIASNTPIPGTGPWHSAKPCSHCGMKVRDFWPSGQGCYVNDHHPDCEWLKSPAGKLAKSEVYKAMTGEQQIDPIIKVQTLSRHHISQLNIEHYWPWEHKCKFAFDFGTVEILGRLASNGHILCRDGKTLRIINCCAFIDWACAMAGAVLPSGEYVPPNDFAKSEYAKLPQLFEE